MFESVVANQVIGAMKADPVPGGGGSKGKSVKYKPFQPIFKGTVSMS